MYKDFERRVIEGSVAFYRKESEESIQKSFMGYLKHIKNRLDDEIKLARLFHGSTEAAIQEACISNLITQHELVYDKEFRVSFI